MRKVVEYLLEYFGEIQFSVHCKVQSMSFNDYQKYLVHNYSNKFKSRVVSHRMDFTNLGSQKIKQTNALNNSVLGFISVGMVILIEEETVALPAPK